MRLVVVSLALVVCTRATAQDAGASLDDVAALVASGRDAPALSALDARGDAGRVPAARYLRARLLERLGRPGEAADALAPPLDGLPSAVARDAERRRALDLARGGRCPEAQPLLAAIATERSDVLAAKSACDDAAGDLPGAIAAARAAVHAADGDFSLRLALAELLARSGDTAAAARELRALVLARPDHAKAALAEARLAALEGTPAAVFTFDEHLARAERLTRARQPARAITELRNVPSPHDRAARARLLHVRGMALFATRHDYAEAAQVLAQAAALSSGTAVADAFHAARALARADREAEAITAYRRLVRAHPDTDEAAESEFLGAMLELRLHRPAGAAHLRAFVTGARATRAPSDAKEARFQLAFADFDAHRLRQARAGFDDYAALGDGGMVRGRGRYWSARAAEVAGARDAAIDDYRGAIAAEPLHWYAYLAHLRLRALGVTDDVPLAPAPAGATPAPLPPPTLPEATRFYASLGLRADALADLHQHEDAVRAAAPHGRDTESLVAAYVALDDGGRAMHFGDPLRQRLDHAPTAAEAWIWAASYPRPYASAVDAATATRHLPDGILHAIMRQESSYDPTVVSGADAIGLLQLLPGVARGLATELGDPAPSRDDLVVPDVNIRLGAAYVAALLAAFGGQAPLAVGAFNAGGPRMRHWLAGAPADEQLDHFVERIPIDQTRNYVRRVTTHLIRYRWLRAPSGWPSVPEVSLTIDRAHVASTERIPPPAPVPGDDPP